MIAILEVSPRPRISTNTGSRASAAVLRNSSSSGVSTVATGLYQPISRPSGMAAATARPKPASDRPRLACACSISSPDCTRCHQATSTSDSGGRKMLLTTPSRGRTSQATARAVTATSREATAPAPRRNRAYAGTARPAGAVTATAGAGRVRTGWERLDMGRLLLVEAQLLAAGLGHLVAQQSPDLVPVV